MIVLDAAALLDVVVDRAAGPWVADQILGEEMRAPHHQHAEVLSALTRLVRAGEIEPSAAKNALREAATVRQRFVAPTLAHLQRAFTLRQRVRVLDGLYVALAEELGCDLVTTDRRLARTDPPCGVRSPQDVEGMADE